MSQLIIHACDIRRRRIDLISVIVAYHYRFRLFKVPFSPAATADCP